MKNRIISFILVMVLIFSLISCTKKEELPPKSVNLTVEKVTPIYTDEGIEIICERFASVIAKAAPYIGYPVINKEKEREIADKMLADIIPIVRAIPIYEDELFDLVDSAEKYLANLENDNEDDFNPGVALGLYIEFSAAIDAERLGRLTYHLQLMRIEGKLADAEERYNKNGLGLETVERYRALLSAARDLTDVRFSDAFSGMMFMLVSAMGVYGVDGGATGITASDALVALKKQAKRLTALSITDAEWQTVAAICEENIPSSAGDDLRSKMLLSLNNDDFFVGAATLIPDVIDLYDTVCNGLSEEVLEMISNSDSLISKRAVYGEIIKDETAFLSLLDKITEELPSPGSFSLSGVRAYDRSGYEAFLMESAADKYELLAAIKAFVANPNNGTLDALERVEAAFISGINPVVAYVYFYL